jgi:hypothetical protein
MERHYIVFVGFAGNIDGRKPLTQTIDVHSAGPEFSALLQVLDASADIVALNVYCKGLNKLSHGLTPMTREDLGMPDLTKIK